MLKIRIKSTETENLEETGYSRFPILGGLRYQLLSASNILVHLFLLLGFGNPGTNPKKH